jgi:hypothetical protein
MNVKKQFLPVNWADGMKINKNHFIESDQHWIQEIRKSHSLFLQPLNYGLRLPVSEDASPLQISIDIDNQGFVHISVLRCYAITRDGSGIEIDRNYFSQEDFAAAFPKVAVERENTKPLYICLAVNSHGRKPAGQANPDEMPPRLPFIFPEYNLSVHPEDDKKSILSQNALILGKLVFLERKPELDESYIPPCQCIYSHPKLAEYHGQLLKALGQIEIDLVHIIQGINEKKQTTSIAESVSGISISLLAFMAPFLSEFRVRARYYPPVYLFENISAFARLIKNGIDSLARTDREELLNYVIDWSNLKQGEFEDLIKQAVEYDYNHDDISQSIRKADPFIRAIAKIFNTLSNLDFIGKKKDRQIFVQEQKEKPASSFLVD